MCTNSSTFQHEIDISNAGDSRAVLARRSTIKSDEENASAENDSTTLVTVPLSIDQNPDSQGEQERILSAGGFVSPPPEPGLSARVWLDAENTQIGLAMARSIGDHAVKGVGVTADPVVTVHEVQEEDEFIILATDGVWEFMESEDAVEIVSKYLYCKNGGNGNGNNCASKACEALIKAAMAKWHEYEGDYRDDITAIVVRLKDIWKYH
jgi:protein phosphatase 2C family protein 2/3